MKAKIKRMARSSFIKEVVRLVKKHGRARVVVRDQGHSDPCDCLCKHCQVQWESDVGKAGMRRRLITSDHKCSVSYKGSDYNKWSGYSESCFMEVFDREWCEMCSSSKCGCYKAPKVSIKKIVMTMLEHDEGDLEPIAIEFGERFKRSIKLRIK